MNTRHDHYATTDTDPGCELCLLAQAFRPIEIDEDEDPDRIYTQDEIDNDPESFNADGTRRAYHRALEEREPWAGGFAVNH